MTQAKEDLYRSAGVDIDAGNEAAARYARLARRAWRPEVQGGIGGFGGGFALDVARYPQPVLVSGTDGVGTKLKIAFATGRHDTIGIDCVAMCVNDILTSGAEPLFFLDYLATGRLDVDVAERVVAGVAEGCARAGCALVGGETAEMPEMYAPGEYDLAGTAVGVVNRDRLLDGSTVRPGDVLLGLASDGVHSNGYSLVRKLVADAGLGWADTVAGWGGTVADELLRPTRIYVRPVLDLLWAGVPVKAMAHITGGGLVDNVPRCLPDGVSARIHAGSWPVPPVFTWLQAQAGVEFAAAARVWNMGIGFVLVVDPARVADATARLTAAGERVFVIGEVVPGGHRVIWEGLE
ncbi:phosphoribosylformylglycinamidine cyclo-ligase [Alicyclobacillus sp.]|uniref:phosphoribosylformylglycinamidine cyclo-ligase n=1 Tax=Alicyclobacillus sp. TaxID=61169 RepID=UPI0025B8B69E|nr:phosphoribosylformylglycinamidine cyclo-ligase [Alicyclobacillus sp.]MCL6517419.1 phosphoribosylformylglycinamidine cyclo-ligase [Alicyclobacillus sp.]